MKQMFAHDREHHTEGWYFASPHEKKRIAECFGTPVFPVIVRELHEGETSFYWAWWSTEEQAFMFVFPRKIMVETCFTYGTKAEEARGRGGLMNVVVERPESATAAPQGGKDEKHDV